MFTVFADNPRIFLAISDWILSDPMIVLSEKTILSQPYRIDGIAI